jgi:hypothetical protein
VKPKGVTLLHVIDLYQNTLAQLCEQFALIRHRKFQNAGAASIREIIHVRPDPEACEQASNLRLFEWFSPWVWEEAHLEATVAAPSQ